MKKVVISLTALALLAGVISCASSSYAGAYNVKPYKVEIVFNTGAKDTITIINHRTTWGNSKSTGRDTYQIKDGYFSGWKSLPNVTYLKVIPKN